MNLFGQLLSLYHRVYSIKIFLIFYRIEELVISIGTPD